MTAYNKKLLVSGVLTIVIGFAGTAGAQTMTREEIRSAYADIVVNAAESTVFDREPDPWNFTTVGQLTEEKIDNALAYLNFLRAIAGLGEVDTDEVYAMRAQHAACLIAANDAISHTPARCEKIPDALYETAYAGANACDLAKLQWRHPEILLEGISYFVRDDGDNNTGALPHRRWLLNPAMEKTGFGLAYSDSGSSYIAMYAVDGGADSAGWDHVAWPGEGLFPAELMRSNLAWSVSLNSDIYDYDRSEPMITLEEITSGEVFEFDSNEATGAGAYLKDTQAFGSGWCLSFTPELEKSTVNAYQQNQVWRVSISGLTNRDGSSASLEWESNMISLTRQPIVNVEISPQKMNLRTGESGKLNANIVPIWADDRTVRWESSDSTIAAVDENGTVTAIEKGTCEIRCIGENDIMDHCEVHVD